MDTIDGLIMALKIIIPIGVVMRVGFCLTKMMYAEDEARNYKRKILYVVAFGIIAELALCIKDIVLKYFG